MTWVSSSKLVPDASKPPRVRRWIPLSARICAALFLALGLVCGWIGWRAYRQQVAIRQIERLGGRISTQPGGPSWLRDRLGNDWMTVFDSVILVHLSGTQVTDAGLVHLKCLTHPQQVTLNGTQVTDAGLVHLRGMTSLSRLTLDSTPVTDSGLVHLKGLTRLQDLWLNRTQVTDAGLVHLKGLTSLQELWLDGTQVTDAGLVHLKGLTSLQELWLGGTQVTDAAVADLRQAVPDLRVIR